VGHGGKLIRKSRAAFAVLLTLGAPFTTAGAAYYSPDARFSLHSGANAPSPLSRRTTARARYAFETVIPGRRNEARSFISACRSRSDRFLLGYCQGFISSKVARLSDAKMNEIERRRKRWKGRPFELGSHIRTDIMDIILSDRFDFEFQRHLGGPATAEDVLDYVINNLLYVEEN